jgi:hypothetical protein
MKAIINGLRYDTEKAEFVGSASADCGRTDYCWWQAGLYKTSAGRYFLAGRGGPNTRFATPISGGRTGGEKIIPMTKDEARAWAEKMLPTGAVEHFFADVIEDA